MLLSPTALPRRTDTWYPLIFMALIYLLSSIPGIPNQSDDGLLSLFLWVPPSAQNILHVPLFAFLAMLWYRALRAWPISSALAIVLAFSITTGYGFLDEWRQLTVPGRYASATDCMLNILGAVLGIWLYRHLTRSPQELARN